MIAIEISIRPWVFETAGDGFSVQLTYRACRSLKSHVLDEHSCFWKSLSDMVSSEVGFDGFRLVERRNVTDQCENRNREHRVTAARNERTQPGDIELQVECEPNRVYAVDAGSLELVESPFDDHVRRRTLDTRANRRCSGCRSDHRRGIGSGAPKL